LHGMQIAEHSPPPATAEQLRVCVTTGSQDSLTKAFDMLIEEGDNVLVEEPTYSGALAALWPMGCKLTGVPTDGGGLKPEALHSILDNWNVETQGPKPRVLYTIPTGSNPTGATLSEDRRRSLYEAASRHDLIILEDDPYWHLQFCDASERPPSLLNLDEDGRVLRFDSFSKVLSSGLRIGWCTGPEPLINRLELHGQSSNLHPCGMSQAVVLALLRYWEAQENGLERHLASVVEFYRGQRDTFIDSANKHLGGLAEWATPEAGMFVWLHLHGITDTESLIKQRALEQKVLMVPGSSFMPNKEASSYVRAAYSTATPEDMDLALQRLAKLLHG